MDSHSQSVVKHFKTRYSLIANCHHDAKPFMTRTGQAEKYTAISKPTHFLALRLCIRMFNLYKNAQIHPFSHILSSLLIVISVYIDWRITVVNSPF